MGSKSIFQTMNFDPGVEDAEAEPVEVVVYGRQVVHVEDHRRAAAAVLCRHVNPAGAADPFSGAALASTRRISAWGNPCGAGFWSA